MVDKGFREEKITISRDELAEVMGAEVVEILKHSNKFAEDDRTVKLIQSLLLAYSADVMTVLFDDAKVDNLEIGG